MAYENIVRGAYKEGANGPAIWRENIIVPLKNPIKDYRLEERSTVEGHHAVGLYVTPPGVTLRDGSTVAAAAIFNTAYLVLRNGSDEVITHLYLSQILAANEAGCPFEISLPGKITMSDSSLVVQDGPNVQADTVLEIQIEYVRQ
ncbi:hypothetical protein [Lewinella sp. W8]|uniref:hypothetical protein n=1 Tax=Lewinella sp. W8 TaxID=2528208 RepID=UPI0010684E59|nr:hypothetical protein [Lewinella sp. W8]MTB53896.1 hypothetical protein [Lewinella sp. W8]